MPGPDLKVYVNQVLSLKTLAKIHIFSDYLCRHNYPEVLRNVLCVIYTAYADSMLGIGSEMIKIENLVGHLLGSVRVPAEGQSHTYFSLGGTDKILLQVD